MCSLGVALIAQLASLCWTSVTIMNSIQHWWYVIEGSEPVGPLLLSQMKGLFQAGQISADAMVWREGLPDWLAVTDTEVAVGGQMRPWHFAVGVAAIVATILILPSLFAEWSYAYPTPGTVLRAAVDRCASHDWLIRFLSAREPCVAFETLSIRN
jgi:hypothetical protein